MIEMAPIRDSDGAARGVVGEGAVGSRWAGRLRIFRYEVRRWPGGVIPDVDEAVESPHRLTRDADLARRLLDLAAQVPTPVWGRDELDAGEEVELQLGDRVVDRPLRPGCRIDSCPKGRARSGLACRPRGGDPWSSLAGADANVRAVLGRGFLTYCSPIFGRRGSSRTA